MPQMAPMNWILLYLVFNLIFLLFIIFNFYTFSYYPKLSMYKKQNKPLSWKW